MEPYKSRVYTDRPAYADFDPPQKFNAIQSIVAKHLKQHPKAILSYSGGSDSDILIDVVELAEYLCGMTDCDPDICPGYLLCIPHSGKGNGLLKWLQQPAGGE